MTDEAMLFRSVPFEMREGSGDGDGLTLGGYAAVFDTPTRIDSWEGVFNETIAKGAFRKSLRERVPVLQVNHGRDQPLPIGHFESLEEDAKGLKVQARLFDVPDTALLRENLKAQSINGMSFRFQVVKDEWRDAAGKVVKSEDVQHRLYGSDPGDPTTIMSRTLKEVRLFELGPVTFPAYGGTSAVLRSQDVDALLSDPQVRARLAAALVGTPSESSEAAGASDEGRAATPTAEPAEPLAVFVPSPAARARALLIESESRHGKH